MISSYGEVREMKRRVNAAVRCEIGKIRSNNEDNFYFCGRCLPKINSGLKRTKHRSLGANGACFGVFDGMGGEQCGELASYLSAKTVKKCLKEKRPAEELLRTMCERMNEQVCKAMESLPYGRMGSTMVSLLFEEDTVHVCNLGDSRAFLLRNGTLEQLSEDHTDEKINRLLGIHRRPRLTRHLGVFADELTMEPYIKTMEVQTGDRYLLCSDGLTDMLEEDEICEIMLAQKEPARCVDKLMAQAMERGGRDNTTVLVCDVCMQK